MKKVGVLLTAGPGGGMYQYSRSILDAALALPREEYSLVFAYRDPFWVDLVGWGGRLIKLHDSMWSRVLNRLWHVTRLPISVWRRTAGRLDPDIRALVRQNCDLWICPNQDRFSFRAEIPALGTVHDLMHRYEKAYAEVSEGGEFAAREFHFGETCRWSKGILVDSDVGKRHVMESYGVSPARIFVLPYIAPRYIYEFDPDTASDIAARYSLPGKYFFYPAQFFTHKNHPTLVTALARMRSAHPDARLVLVGAKERNGFERVKSIVDEHGLHDNVTFLGYVPDAHMAALYSNARALVMPTFFGPTNIPQLEAFVMGCPVATSRIYGIPEQVADAALLFDPHSVDEIHDCLVRLWTDDALCAELAEKGRRRAAAWGPPQFHERLREIIDRLTEPDSAARAGSSARSAESLERQADQFVAQ